ncbi:MAG: HEAT repeat domain-containing protein [Proteobacteria bacterium]|nr:HEAT repeat domain-containing protein [Pseudomonadota bacterium]
MDAFLASLTNIGLRLRQSLTPKMFGVTSRGSVASVPALIMSLKDSDLSVRRSAAEALGSIGAPAVPFLIGAFQDAESDFGVRSAAAYGLGVSGSAAGSAVYLLGGALKDRNQYVRYSSAWALGSIGFKAAAPALTEALKDSDLYVRCAAAWALGQLGSTHESVVPVLIEALNDHFSPLEERIHAVHCAAAEALRKIGTAAVPALVEELKNSDRYYSRHAVVRLLGEIGSETAVPVLTAALKDADVAIRDAAAGALGEIGPEAKAAVPALVAALKEEVWCVRAAAAGALGHVDPGAKEAIKGLIAALKDKDSDVSGSAARALSRIGPAAVPALIAALKDEESDARVEAAFILSEIGPEAKEAVPALIDALEDVEGGVRAEAARALESITGPVGTDKPALIGVLLDNGRRVLQRAADAFAKAGPVLKSEGGRYGRME